MQRVVSFYEKLPRGAAPEVKAKGLMGRYQAKYFGKEPSAMRMLPSEPRATQNLRKYGIRELTQNPAIIHVIGALLIFGYAQNYYFHLRKLGIYAYESYF